MRAYRHTLYLLQVQKFLFFRMESCPAIVGWKKLLLFWNRISVRWLRSATLWECGLHYWSQKSKMAIILACQFRYTFISVSSSLFPLMFSCAF